MPILAVTSLHGAPGVTTVALGLVGAMTRAARPAYYVEADPSGGVVSARFDRPLLPNLTALVGAARHALAVEQLDEFRQPLMDGVRGIVAHPCSLQTTSALRIGADVLARVLSSDTATAVIDLGRWHREHPASSLFAEAQTLLVLVRPVLEQVALVIHAGDAFTHRDRVRLVTVGRPVYGDRQITEVTGIPVVGHLPEPTIDVLADPASPTGRRRSAWGSAVVDLCNSLGGVSAGPP